MLMNCAAPVGIAYRQKVGGNFAWVSAAVESNRIIPFCETP